MNMIPAFKTIYSNRYRLPFIFLLMIFSGMVSAGTITTGAQRMDQYLPMLEGKNVALLINHTSVVGDRLLLDTLLRRDVRIVKIFAPEHGFRGHADAGAHVDNGVDEATGLPVISLYGRNKKPTKEQLADVDVLIYDIQDVGVRFYTYISTLQYAMEACAEYGKLLIVPDRPNPNGFYVDGPVLDTSLRSFVGMQPVPIVYGMTAGEYALMLKGERWFAGAEKLRLEIVPCLGYTHSDRYELPMAPSPNLKTAASVYFYPSLCLFEGTAVSVGRGTAHPFEQWGHPSFKGKTAYSFIPESMPGASKPVLEGRTCYGQRAGDAQPPEYYFSLAPLMTAYAWFTEKEKFFNNNNFFEKLAGTRTLRKQLEQGVPESRIRAGWQKDLDAFRKIRKEYLLYPDFE